MSEEVKNKVEIKVDRPQNKHLKPCKPGETHNPDGRPLGQKNYSTLYREALIKIAKLNNKKPTEIELEIISNGLLNARKGDYRFYKDVLDRLHGTPVNKTELTGKDGKDLPIPILNVLQNNSDSKDMSNVKEDKSGTRGNVSE